MVFPEKLQAIEVPIISQMHCQTVYRQCATITQHNVCTLHKNGKGGSCDGDSGGPLVVSGKLVGILSWSLGFADGYHPDVYMYLDHPDYRHWIGQYVRI